MKASEIHRLLVAVSHVGELNKVVSPYTELYAA